MKLNGLIDHTNLQPDATQDDIKRLCDEAIENHFHSVAINSCWTAYAAEQLKGSDVVVATCIGFPSGAASTEAKVAEAAQAVADGTGEIDMVLNVGRLRMGDDDYVTREIAAVVEAAAGRPVKVILECCLLTDEQKMHGCKDSVAAGAAFVKTSTGFSKGGATVEDVRLMRRTVGDACKIKASGGIHTYEEAMAMVEAGADRLGCSAGIAIIAGQPEE
jgi:deoxyribose-phosphate aldolase